jgi:hypothetical protein
VPESWHTATDINLWGFIGTSSYSPGWQKFTVTCPDTGTSNEVAFAFVGNLPIGAIDADSNRLYLNDQSNGKFRVYDLVTGAKVQDISSGALVYGLAVDDKNGYVVSDDHMGVVYTRPDGTGGGGTMLMDTSPLAVSAKGGYACVSQDGANEVDSLDLSLTITPLAPIAIDGVPWNTEMFKFGNQLACAVYAAERQELSVVKVPEMTLWNSTTLVGLTPMSRLPDINYGGWQLAVFEPQAAPDGSVSVVIATLSQYDKTVVFNLAKLDAGGNFTITELSRAAFPAEQYPNQYPIRIGADNARHELIVAFADPSATVSRFSKVDPATGEIAPLQATMPFLAAWVGVSADGAKIYAGGYDVNANEMVLRILQNQ